MEKSFSHLKQKAVPVPVRTGSHLLPKKQTDLGMGVSIWKE